MRVNNSRADVIGYSNGNAYADIAILNGKVVIPDNGVFDLDIYVKDGKIVSMVKTDDGTKYENKTKPKADRIIDASGKYVIPGIIDPHVHMGLFVPIEKDLESETKSAALGGITTVGCFLGGQSSHLETFPLISDKIEKFSYTDFIPHLVIGTEEQRKEIREYIERFGVTSFKLYMNGIPGMIPDVDDGFVLDVFDEIKKCNKECLVCVHAENRYLVRRADRLKRESNPNATVEDYSDTHPAIAEEEAVIRMSYLAEKSQVPVYFVHMTSKEAIRRLEFIRSHNKFVNVETTSMYLSISRRDENGRNEFKMDPPFRDAEDVEALWNALDKGVIDTIGTHMTKKPAEMFGVYPQKGTLLPGSDADIVIVDMNKSVEVHASQLHSRSDFSVFEGRRLQGWPVTTIKGGQVLVDDGRLTGVKPSSKCLRR